MQKDFVESLLRSGIIEAKAGEKVAARRYLERALRLSSDHTALAEAWFWMSAINDNSSEKRTMLENALSNDMHHARARRALAMLDGKLKPDEIIDPDRFSSTDHEASPLQADRFMCPQCGARMRFAPDGQSLICEFCTSQQDLSSQAEAEEQDFLVAMATARGHNKPIATQIFRCQGCGAEFILPPETISTSCVYCESPYVVNLEESRDLIQPNGIIPHTMDPQQAFRRLESWYAKQQVGTSVELKPPRGVYLPIWTFDIGGEIEYSGFALESDRDNGQVLTKNVRVQESYPIQIDDLPIPASRNTAKHLTRLLPSFELHSTEPYDRRYLANWAAEVYSIPLANASLDARSQAFTRSKRTLPNEIARLHNLKTSSARLTIESFKLVLLPVWITEVPVEDRVELVLINGQNGIVESPATATHKAGVLHWLMDILED